MIPRSLYSMWLITVRDSSTDPSELVMLAGKLTIGSGPGCDVVLADEAASPKHADLELEAATNILMVHDLDSQNGTYVNHERITQSKTLQSKDQIRIGQHLIRVIYQATNQVGSANTPIETWPITRELVQESLELHAELLVNVSERLNSITSLATALEAVPRIMGKAWGVLRCKVILADQFPRLAELGFPAALAQKAMDEHAVVAIRKAVSSPEPEAAGSAAPEEAHLVICVPVMVGEEVAAVTYVYETERTEHLLSQEDVHLAVAISHQASLTIQRARLLENFESLRQLATTDSLTQVLTRRHFVELGEHELLRARRFRRPLSAIVADIDHFKQVIDAHGLATGDEILRAVAARCRLAVRQADVVGRYGGDEFAILVLESDVSAAHTIAERLRKQVAGSPIYTERGLVHISISLGVAGLSEQCRNLPTFIDEALAAVSAAKHGGRNRSEIAPAPLPSS